jgi:hypothetical protein
MKSNTAKSTDDMREFSVRKMKQGFTKVSIYLLMFTFFTDLFLEI